MQNVLILQSPKGNSVGTEEEIEMLPTAISMHLNEHIITTTAYIQAACKYIYVEEDRVADYNRPGPAFFLFFRVPAVDGREWY